MAEIETDLETRLEEVQMKVVAFNGSARENGNTALLINIVLDELKKEGITTELVQLAGKDMHGCIACYGCFGNQDQRCSQDNDFANECIEKMVEADGIIIGSPTYFADVTTETKALIDRAGLTAKANGDMFKHKVGAAVIAVRRAGSIHAFDTINHFFTISQMIIPGSNYWNMGFGLEKGDAQNDEEGKMTMQLLGQNMAWVMKKIS
jgi:multimeric flavodoxin WrbA